MLLDSLEICAILDRLRLIQTFLLVKIPRENQTLRPEGFVLSMVVLSQSWAV